MPQCSPWSKHESRTRRRHSVLNLLRHARELIEIIEDEINQGRAICSDPELVGMAAAELRKRVDAAAATLVPLH
jgi:hypothetical protein